MIPSKITNWKITMWQMAILGRFDKVIHFNYHNRDTFGGFAHNFSILVQLPGLRRWMKGKGNGK
jgi:hypothetical protein